MKGPTHDREESDLPEELRPIADLLDEVAEEEEAILRAAAAMQHAPGSGSVDAALEREWSGAGPRSPRGRISPGRRALAALAAVAAGIALLVLVRELRAPSGAGPGDTYLGSDGFRIVAPVGTVAAFDAIEWEHPEAARARFVVRVIDPRDPKGRAVLLETPLLEGTRYALDPAQAAAWPDEIAIEIEAYDASHALRGLAEASASRSPH